MKGVGGIIVISPRPISYFKAAVVMTTGNVVGPGLLVFQPIMLVILPSVFRNSFSLVMIASAC
jgi:hypothetical protein